MTARLALTDEAEDLVAVFADELVAAGLTPWPSVVGGARSFCARYPTPAAFAAAPVDEQLLLSNHQRRFACWLMVTARMAVSAEYLARADLRLGAIAARHYPGLRASIAEAAGMLGSDDVWIRAQWSALAQLAALHGVRPHEVNSEQLDAGGDELLAAFAHPEHPKAGHVLRSSLVRLRATLFHAGMSDTPPRLHRPNTGKTGAAQWAAVPSALAQTAHRYLAQIELSLRPSTVRIAEQALRELAVFLAREAPEVTCVADIERRHIEDYKAWLASRPRAGGGTLHRNTIRGHLSTLRCFFERIAEWDYPDAPARVLSVDDLADDAVIAVADEVVVREPRPLCADGAWSSR